MRNVPLAEYHPTLIILGTNVAIAHQTFCILHINVIAGFLAHLNYARVSYSDKILSVIIACKQFLRLQFLIKTIGTLQNFSPRSLIVSK